MKHLLTERFEGQCNCENEADCDHEAGMCPNKAGKHKAMHVGALCDQCAEKMPEEYMTENFLWEAEDVKLQELQKNETNSEVRLKRNEVSRLAKQKGYKLSYWQTANRNARMVYTTYGVFPRDQKRPVQSVDCEYTKGFSGYPNKTSSSRGSEFKALIDVEEWLNQHEDYQDNTTSNIYWLMIGSEDTHDYVEIERDFEFSDDNEEIMLFDYANDLEGKNNRENILRWGEEMGFDFIEDASHPFGGYFDTNHQSFMGAVASPDFVVMIPDDHQNNTLRQEIRQIVQSLLK